MPLIDLSRVGNNLIVLAILLGIAFMIYSQVNSARARGTLDRIKGLFGGKKE